MSQKPARAKPFFDEDEDFMKIAEIFESQEEYAEEHARIKAAEDFLQEEQEEAIKYELANKRGHRA